MDLEVWDPRESAAGFPVQTRRELVTTRPVIGSRVVTVEDPAGEALALRLADALNAAELTYARWCVRMVHGHNAGDVGDKLATVGELRAYFAVLARGEVAA